MLEEFRGHGLSWILRKKICDQVIKDGDLPEGIVLQHTTNTAQAHSLEVAGYTEMFQQKGMSVGLTK